MPFLPFTGHWNRPIIYNPEKAESDCKSSEHHPVKASDDLKKGRCLLLAYLSGSSLPIALIKGIMFSRYKDKLCKNTTKVTF
jgi:hypothetical protein